MRAEPGAPERQTPERRRVAEPISSQPGAPVRGPFSVLLRTPETAGPFARSVGLPLSDEASRVPLRLKGPTIIVIARAFTAEHGWFIHAPRAAARQLSRAFRRAGLCDGTRTSDRSCQRSLCPVG